MLGTSSRSSRVFYVEPEKPWGGSWSSISSSAVAPAVAVVLEFDLQRNYHMKDVVLFEENSILLLPECLESSGWQFLKVEVSQESPKNR